MPPPVPTKEVAPLRSAKSLFIALCIWLLPGPALHAQNPPLDPELLMKREMMHYRAVSERASAETLKTSSQNEYDVLHYTLDLAIDPAAELVGGTVTARLLVAAPSIAEIALDLYSNMSISAARRDTVNLSFIHANNVVTVQLDRSFALGETLSVSITFSGHPLNIGFSSFSFGTHGSGAVIVASLSEPYYARTWWPCKDVPGDKATAEIIITVPDTLVVASNGLLQGVSNKGNGTHAYTWIENYPICTYLISVAISNYERFSHYYHYAPAESMEVAYFVFPEHRIAAETDFDVTVDMIEYFSGVFGEYPFVDEKYGMAEFLRGGAMEHQTCTSYGNILITGDHRYDWINAHELAHQWWGDKISPGEWPEIWLNEGFATYSEALWVEHLEGFDAYSARMRSRDYTPGFAGSVYDPIELFGRTVYWKGSWVLHMLRHVMGDDSFFQALGSYASAPQLAYGNATTSDFRSICESFYGSDLSWFFDQWVYGEHRPDYEYSWTQYRYGDLHTLSLTVEQVQTNGSFFEMPIDIGLTVGSRDTILAIWNDTSPAYYTFEFTDSVSSLSFDPDEWILKYANRIPSAGTISPAGEISLHNYPNPFNPMTRIVWNAPYGGRTRLDVFDVSGARVATVFEGLVPRGRNEVSWHGRNDDGEQVSSGIYFARLSISGREVVGKMVLLR